MAAEALEVALLSWCGVRSLQPFALSQLNTDMNKYVATVRVDGQAIRTWVFAESAIHARLLLQYQFGVYSIVVNPTLVKQAKVGDRLADGAVKAIQPIKPIKPLNPAQARVDSLKKNVERSRDALEVERANQRRQREAQRQHRPPAP